MNWFMGFITGATVSAAVAVYYYLSHSVCVGTFCLTVLK